MLHWTRHWASVVVGSTEHWPVVGWSQHQSSPLHHDQNTLAWQLLLSAGAHLTCNYCLKTHQLPMLCCHELYWMVFCWVGRGGQLGRRGAMCVVCWRELVHWSHSSTTHWPAGKWIKTDSFHYFRRGNILINNFHKTSARLFRKLPHISIHWSTPVTRTIYQYLGGLHTPESLKISNFTIINKDGNSFFEYFDANLN